jgi:hypothetical protein
MNKMPEPKYVIAMGACTITGGMFSTDSYSTVRGGECALHSFLPWLISSLLYFFLFSINQINQYPFLNSPYLHQIKILSSLIPKKNLLSILIFT